MSADVLLRAFTVLAAPAGGRSRLSVFYFHRVLERPDPLLPFEPDARMFDRMLTWIASQFRVLDPVDACDRLYDGTLPSRPAVVSFDDGYRDNFTVALPLLQRHRIPAVFFVATGYLDGTMMFNDRVIEAVRRCRYDSIAFRPESTGPEPTAAEMLLPLGNDENRRTAIERLLSAIKHLSPDERLERVRELEDHVDRGSDARKARPVMMDAGQVRALHRAGMQIGGHTRSHPILLKLADPDASDEISGGLADLHDITGERPVLFAYPNGRRGSDFDERHVRMLERAGVRYAFTTHAGPATRNAPRLQLPRFTPWDRSPLRFGTRALLNLLGRAPTL